MTMITLCSAKLGRDNNAHQILKCTFEVDGRPYQCNIRLIKFGGATTLSLDDWESMFEGDRSALNEMRGILALALKGEDWPQTAVQVEPQKMGHKLSYGRGLTR